MNKKKKIKRKLNSWKDWRDKLSFAVPFWFFRELGLVFITAFLLVASIVFFFILWRNQTIWDLINFILYISAFVFMLIITIMELRDNNEEYYKEKNLKDREEKEHD